MPYKQGVTGSSPVAPTYEASFLVLKTGLFAFFAFSETLGPLYCVRGRPRSCGVKAPSADKKSGFLWTDGGIVRM